MPHATEPSPRKRDITRQRLIEAANKRFRQEGYEAVTAASIARDVGMTERTFFRYFPTKADVLVANWQGHGDALRRVLIDSDDPDIATVVTEALTAFLQGVSAELDAGLDSVVRLYTDREAFMAIMEHLLGIEHELAEAIESRTGRSSDDFGVRIAANASLGVFRAAVRAVVVGPAGRDMIGLFHEGMAELRGIFDAIATGAGSDADHVGEDGGRMASAPRPHVGP